MYVVTDALDGRKIVEALKTEKAFLRATGGNVKVLESKASRDGVVLYLHTMEYKDTSKWTGTESFEMSHKIIVRKGYYLLKFSEAKQGFPLELEIPLKPLEEWVEEYETYEGTLSWEEALEKFW